MFDLTSNKIILLCGMNRHGIQVSLKEKLGLTEFEMKR